jgi:signal transduction histidine kinase
MENQAFVAEEYDYCIANESDIDHVKTNTERNGRRLSTQFSFFLFIVLMINTCAAVVIGGLHFKKDYIFLLQSKSEVAGENLQSFLHDILSYGLPMGSLEGVEIELKKAVHGELKAAYANVINDKCEIFYSVPEPKNKKPFYPQFLLPLIQANTPKTLLFDGVYNTFIPLKDRVKNKMVGGINIGVPQRVVIAQTINSLIKLMIIFTIFILFTLLVLYLLIKQAIHPLEHLNKSALLLAKGDFSIRVDVTAKNEIGSLADSFNFMAHRMELNHKKMKDHTKRIEVQNHKLLQTQDTLLQREKKLKDTQAQLVLNEKMASLGILISGIAHEINTPAGAIANVASDLRKKIFPILNGLECFNELTREDQHRFRSFGEAFIRRNNTVKIGGQWKKNKEIRKWLAHAGVDNVQSVVAILAKHDLLDRDYLQPYLELIKRPWIMAFLDSLGTVNMGMQICDSSIGKITEIINALKFYAYTDMDKTSLVDINENIDNVLVLLQNKLKYAIELEKKFHPLPKIKCTCEISQVWTNLICNAYDAAVEYNPEGQGEICITTKSRNDYIEIRITDNGMGIPPENINKIFDPFFTSKEIGKGTGLGLSIVSGIIKKHHGRIDVDSVPGRTTFTVHLPKMDPTKE